MDLVNVHTNLPDNKYCTKFLNKITLFKSPNIFFSLIFKTRHQRIFSCVTVISRFSSQNEQNSIQHSYLH